MEYPSRVEVAVHCRVISTNKQYLQTRGGRIGRIKREQAAVREALRALEQPPQIAVQVIFRRHGTEAMDLDNLQGAFKCPRDVVAKWLGMDDSPDSPITWRYEQIYACVPAPPEDKRHRTASWFDIIFEWDPAQWISQDGEIIEPRLEAVQAPGEPRRKREAGLNVTQATSIEVARVRHDAPSRKLKDNGSELVISLKKYEDFEYLHMCVHYDFFGQRWRTLGLALYSREEMIALRDALNKVLGDIPETAS
jgi:hypothetical protein